MSSNSTTLVDTTSVSDLIGVGLNLAGLTGSTEDEGDDTTSASATLSGYALYSALTGRDPLDPEYYCTQGARRARWFSASLGFDDESSDRDGDDGAILAGGKVLIPFLGRGDVCNDDPKNFGKVQAKLIDAIDAYGDMREAVQTALFEAAKEERGDPALVEDDFLNDELGDPAHLKALLDELGEDLVEGILDDGVDPSAEISLDEEVQREIREFGLQPRVALEFITKQQDGSEDEYMAAAILDWKVPHAPVKLTLNGGWEMKTQATGKDNQGGMAALSLDYQLLDDLSGARPIRFGLSGSAKWMREEGPQYKGQLKLAIPVPYLDGFELPLSLTLANRTDLVDETDVRGLVGFTLDTAQLAPLVGNLGSLLSQPGAP